MSRIPQIRKIQSLVESFQVPEEWFEAARSADEAALWLEDRDALMKYITQDSSLVEDICEAFEDYDFEEDDDIVPTPEEALARIQNQGEWVLYSLGEMEGAEFRIWALYESDGHIAFILMGQREQTEVWSVDTN